MCPRSCSSIGDANRLLAVCFASVNDARSRMRFFSNKMALALLALLILIVLIPLIMFLILAGRNNKRQPPMPTSHPGTNQTLEGAASWPVSSHHVSVCSSESSSANVPNHESVFASCQVISRISIRYKSYTSALVTWSRARLRICTL